MTSLTADFELDDQRQLCPDEGCIGVLDHSLRCPECGAVGEPSQVRTLAAQRSQEDEHDADGEAAADHGPDEFAHRQLCPDGGCVGVLDADGRCRECGRISAATTTDPRLQGLEEPEADRAGSSETDSDDSDFDARELCADGACVGLIGADGRCKECGKPRGT